MKRQVGEGQRQHYASGDLTHRHECDDGEQQTDTRSDDEQNSDDAGPVAHADEAQHADRQPDGDGCDDEMKCAEHSKLLSVTKARDARILSIVIPAKAGIQCLLTYAAGSPLSRGRREFCETYYPFR